MMTATTFQADPYTWKPIEPAQPSINYIQVNVIMPSSSSLSLSLLQTNNFHHLILIQNSDVEEKPWKKKKYQAISKSSRQKLRKEDWMKIAAAKEDKVLR